MDLLDGASGRDHGGGYAEAARLSLPGRDNIKCESGATSGKNPVSRGKSAAHHARISRGNSTCFPSASGEHPLNPGRCPDSPTFLFSRCNFSETAHVAAFNDSGTRSLGLWKYTTMVCGAFEVGVACIDCLSACRFLLRGASHASLAARRSLCLLALGWGWWMTGMHGRFLTRSGPPFTRSRHGRPFCRVPWISSGAFPACC